MGRVHRVVAGLFLVGVVGSCHCLGSLGDGERVCRILASDPPDTTPEAL